MNFKNINNLLLGSQVFKTVSLFVFAISSFHVSLSFGGISHCLNFDKFHNTALEGTLRYHNGNNRGVIKRRGPGISPGYYEHCPRPLSKENKRKMEQKETPSCLILHLLVVLRCN